MDLADALEKHIGDQSDPARCKEAYDALRRVRRDSPNLYVRTALRNLDEKPTPCECVCAVIKQLRKWRHVSGVS
jgi:hypothetical protein